MKKIFFSIALFIGTIILMLHSSCKHEPGAPINDCGVSGVTYENYVKYLIEDKCLDCHVNNSLEPYQDTYADVMVIVNDGRLKNVLTGANGYPIMPYQSEKLPDCTIDNIFEWIDNGAPEE